MEQAWRTMKDSILLKMTYNTDGTKIDETPDEFRQRTAQRSALEGKHGLKAQQRAQQEASLQQPSDPVARQIAGTAAPAPAAPTNVDVSNAQMISAPATSTTNSPAAAQTTPASGIGPNSTGATCGSCGMMTGGGACGNTACATNAGKGLFGLNNQQGGGQVGVQQPNATNQNPEEESLGYPPVPEQRSMEQKIRDITATAGKNFTEDMGFGRRVATAGRQAVDNLRGEDGSLRTGLGLRMQPMGGFGQRYASPEPVNSWWDKPVAAA